MPSVLEAAVTEADHALAVEHARPGSDQPGAGDLYDKDDCSGKRGRGRGPRKGMSFAGDAEAKRGNLVAVARQAANGQSNRHRVRIRP